MKNLVKKEINPKKELTEEQYEIYDNVVTSLSNDASLASQYSNRQCKQCTGKGYYQRDNILPARLHTITKGIKHNSTPVETNLCECIKKKLIKEIKSIPVGESVPNGVE